MVHPPSSIAAATLACWLVAVAAASGPWSNGWLQVADKAQPRIVTKGELRTAAMAGRRMATKAWQWVETQARWPWRGCGGTRRRAGVTERHGYGAPVHELTYCGLH